MKLTLLEMYELYRNGLLTKKILMIMRNNMKKLDLIRCIKQGFIDGTNDRLNEDNEDYEESCTTLDIVV
jgi:hypothetical protein